MKLFPTIGIIGGGFSGMSVAMQLARQAKTLIHIVVFNFKYPVIKGVAYQTNDDYHLLNVPASGMSFFEDDPHHFIRWLIHNYPHQYLTEHGTHNDSFLPRRIYGQYLTDAFAGEMLKSGVHYTLVEEEVTDIEKALEGFVAITVSGNFYSCNKIVFAMGNEEPEIPSYVTREMIADGVYVNNPWLQESMQISEKEKDILLIGSGLTMVDSLLSLMDNGFRGTVHVVSTRGYLPLSFQKSDHYTGLSKEFIPPFELNVVFATLRKYLSDAKERGLSPGAVIAALRPVNQKIWQAFSQQDKKRFLTHVRRLWGISRHRLPEIPYQSLMELLKKERVRIIAGRLIHLHYEADKATAIVQPIQASESRAIPVQRVINCTGPLTQITRSRRSLLQNLLKKNMVQPDDLNMGLRATPEGKVIQDNTPSNSLFTLGILLKGLLWETTAVNEIKQKAKEVARLLLADIG